MFLSCPPERERLATALGSTPLCRTVYSLCITLCLTVDISSLQLSVQNLHLPTNFSRCGFVVYHATAIFSASFPLQYLWHGHTQEVAHPGGTGCLRRMCSLRSGEKFFNFQSQFAQFCAFFFAWGAHTKSDTLSLQNKGGGGTACVHLKFAPEWRPLVILIYLSFPVLSLSFSLSFPFFFFSFSFSFRFLFLFFFFAPI